MKAYNTSAYRELLDETLPSIIKTEEENEKTLAIIDRLMAKGENGLSPEEDRLFDLLVCLVEKYEETAYPIGNLTTPIDALEILMKERDLKQKDLADIFGGQPIVSDILKGKREISGKQAKKLAERFHYPVEVFL